MQKLATEVKLKNTIFVSKDKTKSKNEENTFKVKMFNAFIEVRLFDVANH